MTDQNDKCASPESTEYPSTMDRATVAFLLASRLALLCARIFAVVVAMRYYGGEERATSSTATVMASILLYETLYFPIRLPSSAKPERVTLESASYAVAVSAIATLLVAVGLCVGYLIMK